MSTQQDIYAAGSKNSPPMLNKENYVQWSSRLLWYAKNRPNGKLIYNSIMNGPYVRRMIPELGDADREVPVNETFHEQTNDELTKKELKQVEADDQAIQTILLGLPEDIYAAYNQKEVVDLRAERLAKTHDPLALMANSNNPFNYLMFHQDQPSPSTYIQQPMPNPKDITNPTTVMNMELVLMAKAFKLNYSTPTNNNHRISSNPHNRQIAQPSMNIGQDRQMQMVGFNGGNQFRKYVGKNVGKQNGYNANLNGNGNVLAARAEGNAIGNNGNQTRCYNCRDWVILLGTTQSDQGVDLDEIEEFNANYILMANLQQASTLGTQTDNAPVYDSDGSAEVHNYDNCYDNEIFNMFTQEEQYNALLEPISKPHQVQQNDSNVIYEVSSVEHDGGTVDQHPATVKETRTYFESLYNNLAIEFEKLSKEKSIVSSLFEEKKRLKSDFKIHEDELLDKQIQIEKKIKELDNILVKTGQSIQTMHMLSPKPDSFYHTKQKMALGYQNPFYLKQAQQKQQSLYNGKVLLEKHDPPVVYDSEETLQLAQENFKSLAKEADESLAKHKALELEIERLLRAVVSQDIMSIVQSNSILDTSNLQTKLDRMKERFENSSNDMQQKIEWFQAQLGDQNGKSKDTPFVSNTLDPLSQKLENENVELEFQVSEQKDTTKGTSVNTQFCKKSILGKPPSSGSKLYAVTPFLKSKGLPKIDEMHALINPFRPSTEEKYVPNKVRARVMTNPITVSQPRVITKKDVNSDSNGLSSTGVDNTAKTRRTQPRSNIKNDRVPSASKSSCNKNKKVEVEEHPRNLLLSKNKKHMSSECNNVKLVIRNDKYEVVCAMCKQCLITANHDVCVLNYVNDINSRGKKQKANVSNTENQKKQKPKVIQICLWCVDSGYSKHMTRNLKLLINFVWKFLGTVRFGNDHVAAILGFSDLQCGKILITRVYFVEGLRHNLFSVWQFCDSDLEVAFRRNLEGVDLLKGNCTTNLYTINLHEMASASPICLMAHVTSTKSWLWHQCLSHLNFDTINDRAKNNRVTGLPKFKYHKEHLCPSCEQGKIKRVSHLPKPVPNSKQRLHLLHMDLCGPMRIASINGKQYVLVIVDDYSRYTWVHFLKSKDEVPEVIKTFLKRNTVLLQSPVIIIRTDNGIKFKNQILKEYFDCVGISHQASSVRTHQQNGVVERRNKTLVEAARIMLIFSCAPLFLWAEAIATACYTQNRSIIHRRFNKTPYELINGRKPDIYFLHVFGALCYPKNDREDIRKLGAKGDIGFFIGYSADSCAYRVYNQRTKKIMETMNVTFDELSAMAFEQRSSKPGLQSMTSGQITMYDDHISGQPSAAPRTVLATQAPQVLHTLMATTTTTDTAPTPTNSSSQATNFPNTSQDVNELETQQHVQHQPATIADNVPNAMFDENTFVNPFATPSISAAESSSSQYVDPSNMHTFYQPYPHEYQ
ncbi:retrovirus-related pol polyprotein from transposon TNT 1-94 [Tanacetum coccineum]|uniref:Retrovirus-related pol polyprotein from transposon TNT 1-94 n=1 Tax=Tanacetum coccineum TaxID=301880 RepID=A0ABQ5HU15_9ASTR